MKSPEAECVRLVYTLDLSLEQFIFVPHLFSLDCGFSQDDSRKLASTLFPSVRAQLKRKKDHGNKIFV